MSERSDELYQRAQELPPEERALLALQLLDSVGEPEAEIERAWGEEVRRRIEDVEPGRAVLVPWDEAKQRIFARTRR